jgi:hypothetical protein
VSPSRHHDVSGWTWSLELGHHGTCLRCGVKIRRVSVFDILARPTREELGLSQSQEGNCDLVREALFVHSVLGS